MRCRATLPPAAVGALVLYRPGTGRYSITTGDSVRPPADDGVLSVRQGGLTLTGQKRSRPGGEIFRPADGKPPMAYRVYVKAG